MIDKLWSAARDWLGRLFRRKPVEPGRFVADSKMSWRGWLAVTPWLWPSREYLVYVPRGYGGWRRRPLLVLLRPWQRRASDHERTARENETGDNSHERYKERQLAQVKTRLLRGLPPDQYDFRPDAGGRSLGELAWHLAESDAYTTFLIEHGKLEPGVKPPNIERPKTIAAIKSKVASHYQRAGLLLDTWSSRLCHSGGYGGTRGSEVPILIPFLQRAEYNGA